jgi:hypothetical protein
MAKVSRQRYQHLTESAHNAVDECALDKLIGEFVSASRRANFFWFGSSKARISPRKNSVRFGNIEVLQIQYGRMELQSPAAPSFPTNNFYHPFSNVVSTSGW